MKTRKTASFNGHMAYFDGKRLKDNPYKKGTKRWRDWRDSFKEIKKEQDEYTKSPDFDPHLACFSWPACDLTPRGCHYAGNGNEIETYGHK